MTDACADCYNLKSSAYRACQTLPPGSPERRQCFIDADAMLKNCLITAKCNTTGLGTVLVVAGGLWLASRFF